MKQNVHCSVFLILIDLYNTMRLGTNSIIILYDNDIYLFLWRENYFMKFKTIFLLDRITVI